MINLNILCVYLIIINVITFFAFGTDKWKAKLQRWRIPENRLIFLALLGGIIGAWISMLLFRHKIKDKRFLLFMSLISICWIIGIIVFLP